MPEPRPVGTEALLTRGDELAAAGDARAAVSFYQAALAEARQGRALDPATMDRLRRAQGFVRARVQDFERAVDRAIEDVDAGDPVGALRLEHALDLLKGKRRIYPQQPSMLYYPYLAQRQFFEREEFRWATELERSTADIRAELLALIDSNAEFRPYVENSPDRPARDFHGLNDNRSWTALYLWKHGTFVEEIASRCPATVKAFEKVPLSRIGSRTPSVFFSRLEPGAHIPPHTGMLNSRLICHLPLIVPEGCWLRVGNETRSWEDGKLLIFDDSVEHEARNPTSEMRIVLIFDIWRPELSNGERQAISAMFNAIDEFRSVPDA